MAKQKSSRDFTVHFKPVKTQSVTDKSKLTDGYSDDIDGADGDGGDVEENDDEGMESDDEVYMAQSLISGNVPGRGNIRQRRAKNVIDCSVHSVSSRSLVIAGTVIFLAGLVIGLLIGRFSSCSSQSEDALHDNHGTKCNCSKTIPYFRTTKDYTVPSFSPPTSSPLNSVTVSNKKYTTSKKWTIVNSTKDNVPLLKSTNSSTTGRLHTSRHFPTTTVSSSSCTFCKERNPIKAIGYESNKSLFAPITKEEMENVLIVLKEKGFASNNYGLNDVRISHIYLHPAIKSETLEFLDNRGSFPGRFAKVHVYRPRNKQSDVMEYRVGPLNESFENMIVQKLRKDGEINFNRRPYDVAEGKELYKLLDTELQNIEPLLNESFDEIGVKTDVYPSFSFLPSSDLSDRHSHMVLILNLGESSTLFTLPVSCTVHHPGINVSDWFTSDWFYLNQGPYRSSNEMQEAYNAGKLRKMKFPPSYRKDHKRDFDLLRNKLLPSRDLSDIPPPRTYEPQGSRYTIEGHIVTWMGWQFEVTSDPVRGPAMFDVRFRGQRIAYEISLQDVTLLYSSQTNGHGPLALSDTFYLIGTYNKPILGVDCPRRASVLNTTSFLAGSPIEMDAICVFEADGQRPLWRHGSRGLADHYLVVRAPINLDNYDYIFEWNFYLDGRLQTLLTASGYLYGAFWDPDGPFAADDTNSTPFGFKLGDYLLGPTHDHTFTFKVDLDILGTENSFETLQWKAGNTRDAFRSQRGNVSQTYEYFYFNHTRYIVSDILEQENSFILDPIQPKVWTVVNENEMNSWGVKRGYRVIPHSKYTEVLQDHMMLEAWNQLKYQIAVTKRKETEPYATNSLYDLTHPTVKVNENGEMKIDNEKIRNEDLVLWISEKFYHLPTSEDVPMTLPAQTGFTLKPFSYFDRTPTFDLPAHYSADDEPYDMRPCSENN